MHHGVQPCESLDHINYKEKDNNSIGNLRESNNSLQALNKGECPKKSGLPKYVKAHYKGFQAKVKRRNVQHHIGTFDTPEEAHEAALSWITQYNETTE